MRVFLVIEDETIISIVKKERGSWKLTDYEGAYDTIQEDPLEKFKVGDLYNTEEWDKYYPQVVPTIPAE